jgi:hypothetical protein
MQSGDRYRCPDPACGCEMEVTRAPQEGMQGMSEPICTCGSTMEKV